MSILSTSAKEQTQTHPLFKKASAKRDGVLLWRAAYESHQSRNIYSSPEIQRDAVTREYYSFHQHNEMNLDSYYTQFRQNLKNLKDVCEVSTTNKEVALEICVF
jgi:hypothetical protein